MGVENVLGINGILSSGVEQKKSDINGQWKANMFLNFLMGWSFDIYIMRISGHLGTNKQLMGECGGQLQKLGVIRQY